MEFELNQDGPYHITIIQKSTTDKVYTWRLTIIVNDRMKEVALVCTQRVAGHSVFMQHIIAKFGDNTYYN